MTRSILILVTHLLGVGHLTRAAALARGLAADGHRVTLISGGRPAPLVSTAGLDFIQLPSVHCVGVDFRTLLEADGTPIRASTRAARIEAILAALDRANPDVVITETYPFGRRQLAEEFQALIAAATRWPKPVTILASIRDILNPPSKPRRAIEADAVLAAAYDGVLVHGDERLTPLSVSWPVSPSLARMLAYTGYIAEAPSTGETAATTAASPHGAILVSGGGSAASLPLYRAAIAAAAASRRPQRWHILVGHGVDAGAFEQLRAAAGSNVLVERARPDFPALLAGAAVSVSQAGYNTMIDLGRAGVPAVVVPFEQGKEAEQRLRAGRLADLGLVHVVAEADLSAETLGHAVGLVLDQPDRQRPTLSLDGIAASRAAIAAAIERRSAIDRAYGRLADTLDRAALEGRTIEVWWRDDDAVAPTPALDRLLALAARHGAPIALAVIPQRADASLADCLRSRSTVDVLVHGIAHANHAPPGAKKQELGYRDAVMAELSAAHGHLRALFADQGLPILVPPWNRIEAALVPRLGEAGFAALSTFGPRDAAERHGLAILNTHCDPIDWKAGGGLGDPVALLDGLCGALTRDEPLGLLTHHLVHDEGIWAFVDRLLGILARASCIRLVAVRSLLAAATRAGRRD